MTNTIDRNKVSSAAQAAQAALASLSKPIHCLLLPLHEETLLLPNAAVAEVVSYIEPEPIADAPIWLLGRILWRDRTVPLISFEAASGGNSTTPGMSARIAILNTLNTSLRVPYVAIVLQGIPRLRQIKQESEIQQGPQSGRASVAADAIVDESPVIVPDIDDLETRLEQLI